MKVKCKVCRKEVIVNEGDYNPGDKITVECERCGSEIEVTIPERDEKPMAREAFRVAPQPVVSAVQTDKTEDVAEEPVGQIEEPATVSKPDIREEKVSVVEQPTSYVQPTEEFHGPEKKSKAWIIIVMLLLLACGAGGWWYYYNIYIPEKIDREAPRTYPIVNLNLRSSKMSGSDYNKLTSVPYGGELITYNMDGEWAEVKYVKPDGSESTKGYAAAPYLVDKKDFYLLNSIFGDNDSREILATSKVRRALLDYFKEKGYVGKLPPELMNEVGLSAGSGSQWQVFFPHGDKKPNEVVFKRLVRADSKFTDMALIIKNINSGERKLLYFYFDDDETPHFLGEMDAPMEGTLKDVVNTYGDITPIFAD
ncbi:MAG: hypothetical protein K2H46_00345 [Muribaculaceae bacterium]|nr:hypothetical protein [Muribaculaceae bacterium]